MAMRRSGRKGQRRQRIAQPHLGVGQAGFKLQGFKVHGLELQASDLKLGTDRWELLRNLNNAVNYNIILTTSLGARPHKLCRESIVARSQAAS